MWGIRLQLQEIEELNSKKSMKHIEISLHQHRIRFFWKIFVRSSSQLSLSFSFLKDFIVFAVQSSSSIVVVYLRRYRIIIVRHIVLVVAHRPSIHYQPAQQTAVVE